MRPTFEHKLTGATASVCDELKRALDAPDAPVGGVVTTDACDLWMPEADEHFWSPVLQLSVYPDEGRITGRFGPKPHVWTMFMAIYGVLGLLGTAGLMYGFSRFMLSGMTGGAWWMVAFPAALALIGFVYGAAFIGQGLGSEQMYTLHRFVDEAIERAEGEDRQG
jgi:hypothetical protein